MVSPASGERILGFVGQNVAQRGFHSIGFPSEWGVTLDPGVGALVTSFHSIGFPSEWGELTVKYRWMLIWQFPFNWFPQRVGRGCEETDWLYLRGVSIQLVSPASGEGLSRFNRAWRYSQVSIQLVSPASGEKRCLRSSGVVYPVSIQLVSPASGETNGKMS